jgi:diguanylate cyclase (GGDEF)-like protein
VFSVAVFDLDRFKSVNDLSGHAEGDRVLRAVGEVIENASRPSDIKARTGGDEFAVVLPRAGAADAAKVAERIKHGVVALDEGIDVSYGIAEWPADGPEKDRFLLRADVALYAQKKTSGRTSFGVRDTGEHPTLAASA